MLEVMPKAVGTVLRYDRATVDQYNSTMTYAAMSFY